MVITYLLILIVTTGAQGTSFVPTIGEQWPWSQWTTTTEAPSKNGPRPTITTTRPTTTAAPPPEVTFLPPLESEKDLLIVTDPDTGKVLYVPKSIFWERFGGGTGGWNPSNRPRPTTPSPPPVRTQTRNPILCDFYARNCWQSTVSRPRPTVPSGGGGGSHMFGFPGFHQGAFPGSGSGVGSSSIATGGRGGTHMYGHPGLHQGAFQSTGSGIGSNSLATTSSVGGGRGGTHMYGHPGFHQGSFSEAPVPESMGTGAAESDNFELQGSASTWQVPRPTLPYYGYYDGVEQRSYYPSRRVYQPDLSAENSQVYDESYSHRHYFPLKRGYQGSGIGGTILGEIKKIDTAEETPTSTLPTLIRVTRPSITASDSNK